MSFEPIVFDPCSLRTTSTGGGVGVTTGDGLDVTLGDEVGVTLEVGTSFGEGATGGTGLVGCDGPESAKIVEDFGFNTYQAPTLIPARSAKSRNKGSRNFGDR
jgi:hypothetical protein